MDTPTQENLGAFMANLKHYKVSLHEVCRDLPEELQTKGITFALKSFNQEDEKMKKVAMTLLANRIFHIRVLPDEQKILIAEDWAQHLKPENLRAFFEDHEQPRWQRNHFKLSFFLLSHLGLKWFQNDQSPLASLRDFLKTIIFPSFFYDFSQTEPSFPTLREDLELILLCLNILEKEQREILTVALPDIEFHPIYLKDSLQEFRVLGGDNAMFMILKNTHAGESEREKKISFDAVDKFK